MADATPELEENSPEFKAFANYQRGQTNNKKLRSGEKLYDNEKRQVGLQDKVLRAAPKLKMPVVLYRLLSGNMVELFKEGSSIVEKAFLSTSLTPCIENTLRTVPDGQKKAMMYLVAPSGSQCVYMNKLIRNRPIEKKGFTGQEEVLFGRGNIIHTMFHRNVAGRTIIYARLISGGNEK